MADNNDTKQTTSETPAISTDELRGIIKAELKAELEPLFARLGKLEERVQSQDVRIEEAHTKHRNLENTFREAMQSNSEVVAVSNRVEGKLDALKELLNQALEASVRNSQSIAVIREQNTDLARELYGDPARRDARSVMGELEKMPALVTSAVKTEVTPLNNRLSELEAQVRQLLDWWKPRAAIEAAVTKYAAGSIRTVGKYAVEALSATWVKWLITIAIGLIGGGVGFDILQKIFGGG